MTMEAGELQLLSKRQMKLMTAGERPLFKILINQQTLLETLAGAKMQRISLKRETNGEHPTTQKPSKKSGVAGAMIND